LQLFCASQLHHYPSQSSILRCLQCHKCETCKQELDSRACPAHGKSCRACERGLYMCSICEKPLMAAAFNASQLHNYPSQNSTLRCLQCHKCETCKKELDSRAFPAHGKSCHACVRGHIQCQACDKQRPSTDFNADALHNAGWHQRAAVCPKGYTHGYSTRDIETYTCIICGNLGHTKFVSQDLFSWKRRGCRSKLQCSNC